MDKNVFYCVKGDTLIDVFDGQKEGNRNISPMEYLRKIGGTGLIFYGVTGWSYMSLYTRQTKKCERYFDEEEIQSIGSQGKP